MGNEWCSQGVKGFEYNTEVIINKNRASKNRSSKKPISREYGAGAQATDSDIQFDQPKDVRMADFAMYGRTSDSEVVSATKVIKNGKKMRVYNYKHVPLKDEDVEFSLKPKVAGTYKDIEKLDYENLLIKATLRNVKLESPSKESRINKFKSIFNEKSRDMVSGCIMVDGSKYNGQLIRNTNNKDGVGNIIYPDGSLFEGIFISDDTALGRYIFTNGYVYEGQMKNHKMHGKGQLTYWNKLLYKGEFENGEEVNDKITLSSSNSNLPSGDLSDKGDADKLISFNSTIYVKTFEKDN